MFGKARINQVRIKFRHTNHDGEVELVDDILEGELFVRPMKGGVSVNKKLYPYSIWNNRIAPHVTWINIFYDD